MVKQEVHINDVQLKHLQQLCDAIKSIQAKIAEECFQHLIESVSQRIRAGLKAEEGLTQYYHSVPNTVFSEWIAFKFCLTLQALWGV